MKRAGLLSSVLILLCSSCLFPRFDQAKFEATYRAAKEIEASNKIGISYDSLGNELQSLSRELLIAKDKAATERERVAVGLYEKAIQTLTDCHLLWRERIDSGQRADGKIIATEATKPLIDKYHLTTTKKYVITKEEIEKRRSDSAALAKKYDQLAKGYESLHGDYSDQRARVEELRRGVKEIESNTANMEEVFYYWIPSESVENLRSLGIQGLITANKFYLSKGTKIP